MFAASMAEFNFAEIFQKLLEGNSLITLILFALGAGTWLIGGNLLVALHYRRVGKPVWSGFKPFAFPFKEFNAKEWVWLGVLTLMAMSLMVLAVEIN